MDTKKHKIVNFNLRRGSSLFTVVILLFIMVITGVAILGVSMTENNTEIYQNRRTQAYYLAWSGANSLGEYILKSDGTTFGDKIKNLNLKTAVNQDSFSNGSVQVSVEFFDVFNNIPNQILISSIGNVHGVNRTVKLLLGRMDLDLVIDKAIYSNAPLDITGMLVKNGDVESGAEISFSTNGSNEFTGVAFPNSPRNFKVVDWPTTSDAPLYGTDGILFLKGENKTIYESRSFYDLTVWQNDTLTLSPPADDMQIVVDNMIIDGNMDIDVSSGGRVELYINETLTVTTKGAINSAWPSDLIIYLKKDSTFYMQANKTLKAYVIGPEATMEIQSDQSTTYGALITNVIQKNDAGQGPNGAVYYVAPDADLDLDNIVEYKILKWE